MIRHWVILYQSVLTRELHISYTTIYKNLQDWLTMVATEPGMEECNVSLQWRPEELSLRELELNVMSCASPYEKAKGLQWKAGVCVGAWRVHAGKMKNLSGEPGDNVQGEGKHWCSSKETEMSLSSVSPAHHSGSKAPNGGSSVSSKTPQPHSKLRWSILVRHFLLKLTPSINHHTFQSFIVFSEGS